VERAQAEIIAARAYTAAVDAHLAPGKRRMTVDEAFARYFEHHAKDLPSAPTILGQLRTLHRLLGGETYLDAIDDRTVDDFIARRRGEPARTRKRQRRLVSRATVNREITLLRAVLNRARRTWGVMVADVDFAAHRLREPAGRRRYLEPDEGRRLIDAAAPHLRPVIALALLTGLRRSNLLGLDWRQVDLDRREVRVSLKSKTPGGEPHTVALSADAMAALSALGPRPSGPVFTFKGRALASVKRAFATACRRAGIDDFRFHDLRHTAASWALDAGASLDEVKDMLGHREIATTLRYAHRPDASKRRTVDGVAARFRHTRSCDDPQPIEGNGKRGA